MQVRILLLAPIKWRLAMSWRSIRDFFWIRLCLFKVITYGRCIHCRKWHWGSWWPSKGYVGYWRRCPVKNMWWLE
jgi:hypothetical protein